MTKTEGVNDLGWELIIRMIEQTDSSTTQSVLIKSRGQRPGSSPRHSTRHRISAGAVAD